MSVDVPEHFLVHVRLPDGTKVDVDGRVAKLVEWMLNQRERIESFPYGALTFDMGPRSFQPEIKRVIPRVQAEPAP